MKVEAVEGWLLLRPGCVVAVKGCFHPLPKLFAAPKIVARGSCVAVESSPCLGGRSTYVVDPRHFTLVDPQQALRALRSSGLRHAVARACLELAEILESAGVDYVGVTGSLAYRPLEAGDVDLVVYGARNCDRAYRVLAELRRKEVLEPLTGRLAAREAARKKWDHILAAHLALARSRLLLGVFRGVPYSIRLVHCTSPAPCLPQEAYEFSGELVIEDSSASHYTPALYAVAPLHYKCPLKLPPRILALTHRLRFSELPPGTEISVKDGWLEVCEGRYAVSLDWGHVEVKVARARVGLDALTAP